MAQEPPRKGPHRMKTASKPETGDDRACRELEARVRSLAERTVAAIEAARARMTPEEAARAEKRTRTILERATSGASSGAKRSRRTA